MAQCPKKLSEDLLYDCTQQAVKGIANSNGILINHEDVDWSATTVNGATITDLVLKAGKTGYKVEWYDELADGLTEFVPKTDDESGYKHTMTGRMQLPTAAAAERMQEMDQGRFIFVYEGKFKGLLSAEAFNVLGLNIGMKKLTSTQSANANSASILFSLATPDDDVEKYQYNKFLETDYATSKAAYDALFVAV
jgi:hypothetical protein